MPPQANNMMSRSAWIVFSLLIAVCVVAVGVEAFYLYYVKLPSTATTDIRDLTPYIPQQLVQSKRAGDDAGAVAAYDAIMKDPTKNTEEKALAVVNATYARFHVTGDVNDLIQDVRNLKLVILDKTVSIRTRSNAIVLLETMYNASGKSPLIFSELYKDAPFNTYLVPGDPDLSAINLGEWSYSLRPASVSAIYTAQLYALQYFVHPNQSASTTASYAAHAEEYLKDADVAVQKEAAATPSFSTTSRYLTYRVWRAITIGALAVEKGEPYTTQYKKEYEDFFTYALASQLQQAKDEVLFGRWQFARVLAIFKESAAEKVQLDLLAKGVNALSSSDGSAFVSFLRNEHAFRPTETAWTTIQDMTKVSPDFKTAVNQILASAPTPAAVSAQ